jgi:hypothetical protein
VYRGKAFSQLAQVVIVINHRKLIPALPPLPQVDYFWFWCVAFLQLAKVVIPVYLTNRGV